MLRPAHATVIEAWVHRHSNVASNAPDQAVMVVLDAAGDIVVTGTTSGGVSGGDMVTIKYSGTAGSVLWQQSYNGAASGHDIASALTVDGSGNVVVTGSSWNGANYDFCTAKYASSDGALLWERRYNGPADSVDIARAVAVDGGGNVVVTGRSSNGANLDDDDYYTAKYAAADGALLWEQRYNGPENSHDHANGLAVDGSGNVVVAGTSNGDYYTAKYATADGTVIWERRYNGPANSTDHAAAVAVDNGGNVVVTGDSNGDCYTAKYAAADGTVLWERRYGGPATFDYQASALAVDGSANVVVTGTFSGAYYTAKYAAADGALLWEQPYRESVPTNYLARAVAMDGRGNVVVTGRGWNGLVPDFYTAKYAAADGALLWEKRFHGPGLLGDSPPRLALGPDGMVAITGKTKSSSTIIVYREVLEASIDLTPAGVRLRFSGVSGRRYNIERAPALTGPWITINTQNASPSGLFEYLDTHQTAAAAYFRAREQ